jgi:ribosomal protein S18 acetylase RimI-like enzyme
MKIEEVFDPNTKSLICSRILRALPDWFAIEKSIIDYTEEVRDLKLYAAFDNTNPIGFVAVKIHNEFTAEIIVMGIMNDFHRRGIGASLIACVERFCVAKGLQYLTVKTLDASAVNEPYERTRKFYKSLGFVPLEVFPLYWDKENPCLFLAKHF